MLDDRLNPIRTKNVWGFVGKYKLQKITKTSKDSYKAGTKIMLSQSILVSHHYWEIIDLKKKNVYMYQIRYVIVLLIHKITGFYTFLQFINNIKICLSWHIKQEYQSIPTLAVYLKK